MLHARVSEERRCEYGHVSMTSHSAVHRLNESVGVSTFAGPVHAATCRSAAALRRRRTRRAAAEAQLFAREASVRWAAKRSALQPSAVFATAPGLSVRFSLQLAQPLAARPARPLR